MSKYISRDRSDMKNGEITFLLPLCGRSLDLIFLYEQGFQVIGCEFSEHACQQFFSENKLPVVRNKVDEQFTCFEVFYLHIVSFLL